MAGTLSAGRVLFFVNAFVGESDLTPGGIAVPVLYLHRAFRRFSPI